MTARSRRSGARGRGGSSDARGGSRDACGGSPDAFGGRRVLLGVGASVAAYKAVALASRLRQAGAQVQVVLSRDAARFVGVPTWEAVSGRPVFSDPFAPGQALWHVRLAEEADALLVAPATADGIGRFAAGLADDALTTLFVAALGRPLPVVLAPAMNRLLWASPTVQANVERLRSLGCAVVEPEEGWLAEGYAGPGRLAGEERILGALAAALSSL